MQGTRPIKFRPVSIKRRCNYTGNHALQTKLTAILLCGRNMHGSRTSPDELSQKALLVLLVTFVAPEARAPSGWGDRRSRG
uniref:Uncharacterized protein n=1 Tax=Pararge aegeria TaxID=116150 RepID=S4PAE2_9NEOP